jgi:hydroxyacylglutathione hydrolase
MPLTIETFTLGPWMTNCYVVRSGDRAWIIDAGFDPGSMIDFAQREKLRVEKIILTHAHVDHIGGLHDVHMAFAEAPILIHEAEHDFPTDPALNLSAYLASPLVAPEPTGHLAHGDTLTLGDDKFEVRHTPGHSPGGITLYGAAHHVALVGDTLFHQSVGRTDFPTSDPAALDHSIRTQLYTLPDNTRVLPGHMDETTIGAEKRGNPYVRP